MPTIKLNDRLGEWFKRLGAWLQDVTGPVANQSVELTALSDTELAEIMNQRWNTNERLLRGENLVKFSFFLSGQEAGKSVCCLTQCFTDDKDLNLLVEAVTEEDRQGERRLRSLLQECYGVDPLQDEAGFRDKAKQVDLPYASGFLIGGDYLLTNCHVIKNTKRLKDFKAVFGYEASRSDAETDLALLKKAQNYSFNPDFWVASADDSPLDYVLLKLKPLHGQSVSANFQPLDLRPVATTLHGKVAPSLTQQELPDQSSLRGLLNADLLDYIQATGTPNMVNGDAIHIIQHPGGRPKEIAIFNNRLFHVYQDFLEYQTDAEPGSSGSPLFNTDWQVVGLHQAALLDEEKLSENPSKQVITSYLGIRIDRIIADLRTKPKDHPNYQELQEFLKRYIDPPRESPALPQVFVLAGRNRSFLGTDYANLERQSMLNLRRALKVQIEQDFAQDIQMVEIDGQTALKQESLKQAVQAINQRIYADSFPQRKRIAIELLIDRRSSSSSRGMTLFYSAADAKAQQVAMALQASLRSFANQPNSPLPYIGALPDTYTSSQRLGFCRDVNIPSVVIYVGSLDHDSDRSFLESMQADLSVAYTLAKAIADGSLTALKDLD